MIRPARTVNAANYLYKGFVLIVIFSGVCPAIIAQVDAETRKQDCWSTDSQAPKIKLRDRRSATVSIATLDENAGAMADTSLSVERLSPERSKAEVPLTPWWLDKVRETMRPKADPLFLSLDSLLVRTVAHSSQVKVYSDLPLIRETAITGASAAFDWHAFLDSRWNDTNDPVGNTLTGAFPRYKNQQLSNATGLRRRTLTGGRLEASQQFGFQNSNSIYLNPNPQATTRLAISYTQPLMRGSGEIYNKSLICLAEIETKMAESEFCRKLQSHLLDVTHAFWTLYIERTNVVLKRRSLHQAEDIAEILRNREGIDSVPSQTQRAEAEIAMRQSELIRARASVRTSEARLRSLVNDPQMGTFETVELIPLDQPIQEEILINRTEALSLAIMNRPEIDRSLAQIKAGAVRMDMAKNEWLPLLNVITQTYVAALSSGDDVAESWSSQFTTGDPSYSSGLQLEVPVGNRVARARLERRTLECRQLRHEYETAVKALALEVGMSVREVRATFAQMNAQSKAVRASGAQLELLERRWKLVPGEGDKGSLILENILQAQSRSSKSAVAYVNAWVKYNLALVDLKRATGELLRQEQITWSDYRDECDGLKSRIIAKADREHLSTESSNVPANEGHSSEKKRASELSPPR